MAICKRDIHNSLPIESTDPGHDKMDFKSPSAGSIQLSSAANPQLQNSSGLLVLQMLSVYLNQYPEEGKVSEGVLEGKEKVS